MITSEQLTGSKQAANAVSRCRGAMIFGLFGAVWLLLSLHYWGRLNITSIAAIAAVGATLVTLSFRVEKRAFVAAEQAYPQAERRKNARSYGIVNAITWTGAFIAANVLGNTGHPELILPGVVLIVGLHLFFMPPLYRHSGNTIAGICITAWAILSACLFHGETIAAVAALGTGLIVWTGAAFSLRSANTTLRALGL